MARLETGLAELVSNREDFYQYLGPGKILWEAEKAISNNSVSREVFDNYSQGQLNDLIFSSELSGNDQLIDFLSEDKASVRIALLIDFMESKDLHQFRSAVEEIISQEGFADANIIFTGNPVLLSNMDIFVAETQLYSMITVLVFLLIALPLIFKSFYLGLFGVLFNLFPLAFTYGLMGWFDININLATVVLGGVALSLVVDDTIHMLVRFQQYLKLSYAWDDAVDQAVRTIGHSITLTSVILIACFCLFSLSDFIPTKTFGILMTITVIMAWCLDLFLLPILLKYLGKMITEPVELDSSENKLTQINTTA